MQLSGAAVWWEEWQLRILVLASLGIQWLLLLAAPMRRFTIPVWFRTCIGVANSSSDAVAIYALAGHPLQPPRRQRGQQPRRRVEQQQQGERGRGPVGSCASHPPRRAAGAGRLPHRRQRPVDATRCDGGDDRLVRLLQVVAQAQLRPCRRPWYKPPARRRGPASGGTASPSWKWTRVTSSTPLLG